MDNKGFQRFADSLFVALKERGLKYEDLGYGIRVVNGIDTWLLEIVAIHGRETAMIKLFHSSLFRYNKLGRPSSHTDMHVQFTKECTAEYVVSYIAHHDEKYWL